MADVKTVDIDGSQWDIKDQNARDRIAKLEEKKHIKITQLINEVFIKLDLVEIDNEKFLRIRIWSYVWSGKIGEVIANFTQDIGLENTTGCLMDADLDDKTGRLVVHLDIEKEGNIKIFPCITNIYSGNYKKCKIYGNAFIKI